MAQILNIPEIIKVKNRLMELQAVGLVKEWELPYENLLTRLSAALFFLTPDGDDKMAAIIEAFKEYPNFSYRENIEKTLSLLKYRITFAE